MNVVTTRVIIALAVLLVLGAVNHSIYGKERTIATGEEIFLELAPVDPRSLMQGDYMALRFRLAQQIDAARREGTLADRARLASLHLDERRIGTLETRRDADLAIRFKIRNNEVWLGTNAYFFEEGTAQRFDQAKYGEFRIDARSGEAVLVGLRDEHLQKL